jgi:hypothetical protein
MVFIRRHPALVYFVLVFLTSWGGMLGVLTTGMVVGLLWALWHELPACRS